MFFFTFIKKKVQQVLYIGFLLDCFHKTGVRFFLRCPGRIVGLPFFQQIVVIGQYAITPLPVLPKLLCLCFLPDSGADELVFYDITASVEGRKIFTDILTEAAKRVFIPLTVGGGISTLDDFDRVLKCGADKVSVNSGAIKNPELITEAAHRYGDQCVVLSMDVKRVGDEYHVFKQGGRVDTGIDALEWAESGVRRGAGELVVNSIDTDGVKQGFDIPMLLEIAKRVDVPIIALVLLA